MRGAMTPRGTRWLAALGVLLAFGALGVGVGTLYRQIGQPWSGIPIFRTGDVGPRVLAARDVYPKLRRAVPQTHIIAIEGVPMADGKAIRAFVRDQLEGTPLQFRFRTAGGEIFTATVRTRRFTSDDALSLFLPVMVVGFLMLAGFVTPVFASPDVPAARALALMGIGLVSNFSFLLPDYFLGYRLTPYSFVFGFAAIGGLLHFGLLFPSPLGPMARWPRATLAGIYGLSATFWVLFALAFEYRIHALFFLEHVEIALLLGGLGLVLYNLLRHRHGDTSQESGDLASGENRRRNVSLLLPAAGLFGPAAVALAGSAWGLWQFYIPPVFYLAPVPPLVFATTTTLLSNDIFRPDAVSRTLVARSTIMLGAVMVFSILVACLSLFTAPATAWISAALLTLLMATGLPLIPPLYARLEDGIESVLFPRHRQLRESLQGLSRDLGRLRHAEELVRHLRTHTNDALGDADLRVLACNEDSSLEEIAPPAGGLRLSLNSANALCAALLQGQRLLPGTPRDHRVGREARDAAATMQAEAAIPLGTPGRWTGALVTMPRADGRPLDTDDAELLQSLAGPLGVALENAAQLAEIETLQKRLEGENLYLRSELDEDFDRSDMIGESEGLREALRQIQRVASTDASVLIVGETGTGKELAVRTLHRASPRAERVLVRLACAALPESLLESELFGHERGAFTGADRTREGRFEIADGGTLFFDDVDTLSLGVQAKLLRALQEGEVQRLGSNVTRKVDVRIVAATNRDLQEEVRAGRFREDLYYRLAVVPVHLPPLRERRDDIPLLVSHLVPREAQRLGREIREVSAEAMLELQSWDWPGNIRELRNVLERAIVLCEDGILRLPAPLGPDGGKPPAGGEAAAGLRLEATARAAVGSAGMQDLLRDWKKALIEEALARSNGNQRVAAETLGLHRPSLSRMIRDLGLRDDS